MIRIIVGTLFALAGALFLSVGVLESPEGGTRGQLLLGSMILGVPPLVVGLLLIRWGSRAMKQGAPARAAAPPPAPPPPPPPPERGFPPGPDAARIELLWSGSATEDATSAGPESLPRATSVVVSDAGHLVAGFPEGLIRVWRLPGMESSGELVGHGAPVGLLATDAGERLVSRAARGQADGAGEAGLRMWDLAALSPTWELHTARTVVALEVSRDGRHVVAGAMDGAVDSWDAFESPEPTWSTGQFQQVTALAFAPDDRAYASGGADGRIRIGRVMEHETRDGGMHPGVAALAFVSQDRLLSAGLDQRVRLWNLATATCEAELELPAPAVAMAFRPDDRAAVLCTEDGALAVWNLKATSPLATTEPLDPSGPCRACISRDGRYAVVRGGGAAAVYRIEQ